jgi:Phospholipase_D-nuclease N-terminal
MSYWARRPRPRYPRIPPAFARTIMIDTLTLLAQQPDGGDVLGGAIGLMCVFWVLGILATIFWLWMLIDALMHEPTTNEKILWFLVIFFLHILGALIYFFVRKRGRT